MKLKHIMLILTIILCLSFTVKSALGQDWWNSSWTKKYSIIINNTDTLNHSYEIIYVNTTLFEGTDCYSNPDSTRIILNNITLISFEWYNSSKTSLYFINNLTITNGTIHNSYDLYCNVSGIFPEGNSTLFYIKTDFEDGTIQGWQTIGTPQMDVTASCAYTGSYGLSCNTTNYISSCYYNLTSQANNVGWLVFDIMSPDSDDLNFHFWGDGYTISGEADQEAIYNFLGMLTSYGHWYLEDLTGWVNAGSATINEWYNNLEKWNADNTFDWIIYNSSTNILSGNITSGNASGTPDNMDYFELFDGSTTGDQDLHVCIDNIFYSRNRIDTYVIPSTITLGEEETAGAANPKALTITLNQPSTGISTNNPNLIFNFTVLQEDLLINNCTLWVNFSGNWELNQTNASEITNNTKYSFPSINNIPLGQYKWNVECYSNESGRYISNTNYTLIIDNLKPYFLHDVKNQTFFVNTTRRNFRYDINASDNVALDEYFINDTTNFQIDSNGILGNKTEVMLGNFSINVSINDTSNNINWTIVWIDIQDIELPVFTSASVNVSFFNHTDWSFDVNATDPFLSNFSINESIYFQINKSTGILTNQTNVPEGNYSINISVNDTSGNINWRLMWVDVKYDINPPYFLHDVNNLTFYNNTNWRYDINATDETEFANFTINESTYFSITNDGILTNKTDVIVPVGNYSINITINDTSGNDNSTIIWIDVQDGIKPYFTQIPINRSFYNHSEFSYDLNMSDNYLIANFTINSTTYFSITNDGILTNKTGVTVPVGNYSINVSINDTSGNYNSTIIWIDVQDGIPPYFIFESQIPSDITSFNVINVYVNITYNISDNVALNGSTFAFYHKTNSSVSNFTYYLNGTGVNGYTSTFALLSNSSTTWNISLSEDHIYPANYLINQTYMKQTIHSSYGLTGSNNYIKIRLFNISNRKNYNYFEIMANTTDIGSLRIYYCNSSYSTGSPATSTYCTNFFTISARNTFNHSHPLYSEHQVASLGINTTSGMIGNVFVTNTSYFLLRGITGTTWNVWNISNVSESNAIQTSSSNGNSWNDFIGTFDAHIHQYDGTEIFWYYACIDDISGNNNCSDVRYDLLELAGLPPSSPNIYAPIAGVYSKNITINYTAAESPNNYPISYYNITLINGTDGGALITEIIANNSVNLSYIWDSTIVADGEYFIKVEACDNYSQCSFGLSDNITIDNSPPYFLQAPVDQSFANHTNFSYDINATDVITSIKNYTINDTTNFEINATTGVLRNLINLVVRLYSVLISVFDINDNVLTSELNITATDGLKPYFVQTLLNRSFINISDWSYDINASDNIAVSNYSTNDSRFQIDANGVLTNATYLAPRNYSINITINDTTNNKNWTVIWIEMVNNIDVYNCIRDAANTTLTCANGTYNFSSINDTRWIIIKHAIIRSILNDRVIIINTTDSISIINSTLDAKGNTSQANGKIILETTINSANYINITNSTLEAFGMNGSNGAADTSTSCSDAKAGVYGGNGGAAGNGNITIKTGNWYAINSNFTSYGGNGGAGGTATLAHCCVSVGMHGYAYGGAGGAGGLGYFYSKVITRNISSTNIDSHGGRGGNGGTISSLNCIWNNCWGGNGGAGNYEYSKFNETSGVSSLTIFKFHGGPGGTLGTAPATCQETRVNGAAGTDRKSHVEFEVKTNLDFSYATQLNASFPNATYHRINFSDASVSAYKFSLFNTSKINNNLTIYCAQVDILTIGNDSTLPSNLSVDTSCGIVTYTNFNDYYGLNPASLTLNQPTNDTVTTNRNIGFNFTTIWYSNLKIENCSLWANFSGTWAQNQTLFANKTPTLHILNSTSNKNIMNYPYGIAVSGDYAYVASSNNNSLIVLNITNKSAIYILNSTSSNILMGSPNSIAVSGDYAYVASSNNDSLTVLNITNKSAISIVNSTSNQDLMNTPTSVTVSGDYAYVASSNNNSLIVLNITNKSAIYILNSTSNKDMMYSPQNVAVSGDYAYVASSNNNSLIVLNITNKSAIYILNSTSNSIIMDSPYDVEILGDYAYVASFNSNSLVVLNITNKSAIYILNSTSSNKWMRGAGAVAVQGDYAFITTIWNHSITMINITDKTAITILNSTSSNALMFGPTGVAVSGDYAYVTAGTSNSLTSIFINTTTIYNNTLHSINVANILPGDYIWGVRCYDNTSGVVTNENFTLVIEELSSSDISVILNEPTNGSGTYNPNLIFNFTPTIPANITATNCSLWANFSGTWARNQTIFGEDDTEDSYANYSFNSNGNIVDENWNTYNTISTERAFFLINYTIPPNVSYAKHKIKAITANDVIKFQCWNGSNWILVKNLTISATQTYDIPKKCLDSSPYRANFTILDNTGAGTPSYNIYEESIIWGDYLVNNTKASFDTVTLPVGDYIWNVQCFDNNSYWDWGNTNNTLYVSTSTFAAQIILNEPANNTITLNTNIGFNFTPVVSSGLSFLNCSLWTNHTGTWKLNQTLYFSINISGQWVSDDSRITGLGDIGANAIPTIAFNVTGDGNWTLIAGNYTGGFRGFYWNGSQWIPDSSRVVGLTDIGSDSAPSIAFNITRDGNWTLITGEANGIFYGYYWNGTAWNRSDSRVTGLGDIGFLSAPSIAFNVTGDGNWTLIAGNSSGDLISYHWNQSQWINYSYGLTGSKSKPSIAYNLIGDNNWTLISGAGNGLFYSYYWNGTEWVTDSSRINGLGDIGSNAAPYIIFNVTGDNNWTLIVGDYFGQFHGYYWHSNITATNNTKQSFPIINIGSGDMIWNVRCFGNDSVTYTNNTNFTLTTGDDKLPYFLHNLTNHSISVDSPFFYDINATDNIAVDSYFINDTINFAIGRTTGILVNKTYLNAGNYSVNITVNDTSNNQNSSVIWIGVSDTTPPLINIISPLSTVYLINDTLFNISLNEAGSWCGFSLNGEANISMNRHPSYSTYFNFTYYNMSDSAYNVKFFCNDTSNNWGESGLVYFAVDTIPPQIALHYPENDTYLRSNISIQFNFTASNSNEVDYCILYINISGSWAANQTNDTPNNGTPSLFQGIDLPVGQYMWSVWCNDSLSVGDFSQQGNFTFTIDLTYPQLTILYPVNNTRYAANITQLNFSVSDDYLSNCWYSTNNGQTNNSVSCTSNITGITAGVEGTNSWIMAANDSAGNINQSTVIFYIDTVPPYFNPAIVNLTVEINASWSYDINYTEANFDSFALNNTDNFSIDSNGILTNLTHLPMRNYSVLVTINDTSGNSNSSIVQITVDDLTYPYFTEDLVNQTIEYGINFAYDINYTEINFDSFVINNSNNFTISNSTGILSNITSLELGNYSLSITIRDIGGNENTSYITVQVVDTTYPYFNPVVVDQQYNNNSNWLYDINATDNYHTINFTVNDTSRFQINLITGILTNLSALSTGTYSLNVTVRDYSGNDNSSLFNVTVTGITYYINVVLNEPANATNVSERALEFNFTPIIEGDLKIENCSLWTNSSGAWAEFFSNQSIVSNNTKHNFTALNFTAGHYIWNVICYGNDSIAYTNNTNFYLFLNDTTPPVFLDTNVTDQTFANHTTFIYDINATDYDLKNFTINDTTNFQIGTTTGILQNLINLAVRLYSILISVFDTNENVITAELNVTAYDGLKPYFLENPVNQQFENQSDWLYDINASDNVGVSNYTLNDTTNFWIDLNGILRNATYLAPGTYSLNITINDTSNNDNSSIFNVIITEAFYTIYIALNEPANQTNITETFVSFNFTPIIYGHLKIENCSLWINSTGTYAQNISNSSAVSNNTKYNLSVLDLGPGHHLWNVVCYDNNSVSYTNNSDRLIFVRDITLPSFTQNLVNQTFYNHTDWSYDINATDTYSFANYSINDTTNFKINSTTGILTNLTMLPVGNYSINVSINDTSNNKNWSIIWVGVKDGLKPYFLETPINLTVSQNTNLFYDINASDNVQVHTYFINDTDNFSIDINGILTNKTLLGTGNYSLNITINDTSGNDNSTIIWIGIGDTTPPIIEIISPIAKTYIINDTQFNVSLNEAGSWCGFSLNGEANISMTAYNTTYFNFTYINMSDSAYNVKFFCNDTSNNWGESGLVYFAIDTVPPAISLNYPTNNSFLNSNISIVFNITATNAIVDYCILYINISGIWAANQTNDTPLQASPTYFLPIDLAEASYMWSAWCNDSASLSDFARANYTFTIDLTYPQLTILYPINNTRYASNITQLNFSVSDDYLQACWYSTNNGQTNNSVSCTSNITGITAGVEGTNSWIMAANDSAGNINQSTVIFYIDTVPPYFNPAIVNLTVDVNSTWIYDINYTEANFDSWALNDTTRFQIDSNGILTNNTYLIMANYSVLVTINDTSGNSNSSIVQITVDDLIYPYFNPPLANQTLEANISLSYDINYTEANFDSFTINNSNFAISNSTGELSNLVHLAYGNYSLLITIRDIGGNENASIIQIIVTDTQDPFFIHSVINQSFFNHTDWSYDINGSDNDAVSYSVNDTTRFQINASGILTNNTHLATGNYSVNISINDSARHYNNSVIQIELKDGLKPYFLHALVVQTVYNSTDWSYDINASDNVGIQLYATNYSSLFSIDANGVLKNITVLPVGTYSVNITINDTSNNDNSSIVTIQSRALTDHYINIVLNKPVNNTILQLKTNISFNFTPTIFGDIRIVNCSLWTNHTGIFAQNNTNISVITNATEYNFSTIELNSGDYTWNVVCYDNLSVSYTNNSNFILWINDTIYPYFIQTLVNQTFYNHTDWSYDINSSDNDIVWYTINDTTNFKINSITGILTNLTMLPVGNYSLNITTKDDRNNDNSTIIWIGAKDGLSPYFTHSVENKTISVGISFAYDINASDNVQVDSFVLNDTSVFQINRITGLLQNISLVAAGEYHLRITINDTSNNQNSTDIVLNVLQTVNVTLNKPDTISTIEAGINVLNFTVIFGSDVTLQNCSLWTNSSGTWAWNQTVTSGISNNTVINFLPINFTLGVFKWNVYCYANDLSNDWADANWTFTTEDTTAPVPTQILADQQYYWHTDWWYDINITEYVGVSNYTINDSRFMIGFTTANFTNATDLSVGIYSINLTINDTSGNKESYYFRVTVLTPILPAEEGAGGGSPSESEKPHGNMNDTCIRMGGILTVNENGDLDCIIPEEKPKEDVWISPLAQKLYPKNPLAASILLIILMILFLIYGNRFLEKTEQEIKTYRNSRPLNVNIKIAIIILLAVLFFNFVRLNIDMNNYTTIGNQLWPSFPIGGWILCIAAIYLYLWLFRNFTKIIGLK